MGKKMIRCIDWVFVSHSKMVSLRATLLPHQEEGMAWCLEKEAAGCILADDMGLGKTVTTCAVLVSRKVPTLITAPLALLDQWKTELEKHTEGFRVMVYQGKDRFRHTATFTEYDIVVTNPESVLGDFKRGMVAAYEGFERVVIDEAHGMRNPRSKVQLAFRSMFDREDIRKILLTGTPICNNTDDIISLLGLLNLEVYSDPAFWKGTHIERRIEELHKVRRQVVLRRTKEEILAGSMPRKEVRNVAIELDRSELYSKEYNRIRARNIKPIIAKILRLRQCVNQVDLVHGDMSKDPNIAGEYGDELPSEVSAKLVYIRDTVAQVPEGDKIVIFSQWTTMLHHIKRAIGEEIACEMHHGKMGAEEKRAAIERFKTDPAVKILLVSLRSGGCGLNLVVANHVILTEPYFNVAEEKQAIDRVYRIGQTKDVFVHRLYVPSTVESWIQQLQKMKATITDTVLEEDSDTGADEIIEQKNIKLEMFQSLVVAVPNAK